MNGIFMIRSPLILLIVLMPLVHADPLVIKAENTGEPNGSGNITKAAWAQYPISVSPWSSATPTPRTAPTPFPLLGSSVNDDAEVQPERDYPPPVIHRSSMTVGRQISVPVLYAAPQVVADQHGGVTVIPATPKTFQTIQTGTTTDLDAEGNTMVRDTELNGLVNYGSPIKIVVPSQNSQGQQNGTQVIIAPNPVLVPVTRTIEIQQSNR